MLCESRRRDLRFTGASGTSHRANRGGRRSSFHGSNIAGIVARDSQRQHNCGSNGRTETGTGITGYYPQTIAEELNVRPETITLIMGDTDRTPDGGFSAGFLNGMYNVRKVAAYTYQSLPEVAATQLGVPKSSLSAADGVVTSGGKKISYAQLVQGQQDNLVVNVHCEAAEHGIG